jgi:hypothetical protein
MMQRRKMQRRKTVPEGGIVKLRIREATQNNNLNDKFWFKSVIKNPHADNIQFIMTHHDEPTVNTIKPPVTNNETGVRKDEIDAEVAGAEGLRAKIYGHNPHSPGETGETAGDLTESPVFQNLQY